MKRPFPPAKKETGKIITTKLKQRASLQIWLRKEVIDGWTKGDKKRDRGRKRRHLLYSKIAIKFLAL